MKYNLEERLIRFAVAVLEVVDKLCDNKGAAHLGGQLIRSGTAPALMFAEAIGAESRKDFIHKMKLALKELRETQNCLKIIFLRKYAGDLSQVELLIGETNELIAIFVKSIQTAKRNLAHEKGS